MRGTPPPSGKTSPRRHACGAALLAAAATLGSLAVLPGCATKSPPDRATLDRHAFDNLTVPASWAGPDGNGAGAGSHLITDWVVSFNDPILLALVSEALSHNIDLRLAAARFDMATAYLRASGAALYPAVSLVVMEGGKLGDGSGFTGSRLNASWEIDLWGRVRYGREGAWAQVQASAADLAYAKQSIAALVARSWMLAIEARLQNALAADVVRANEQLADLTRDRERIGRGDAFETARAAAGVESARDAERQSAYAQLQAQRALEVVLGRYPAAALASATGFPKLPAKVPTGLPSELLERRPDVVAAERRVAAAFNRVEEAKAARLPRIGLSFGASNLSSELFVLQDRDNPVWSLGGNLIAPLFQGGALLAQVELRTAEQQLAIAEYAKIGIQAFADVETALAGIDNAMKREAILLRAVKANERALEAVRTRYRIGSADLRQVQEQQVALVASQAAVLRMQAEQRVQRVNLHLALGGGFEPAPTLDEARRHAGSTISTGATR